MVRADRPAPMTLTPPVAGSEADDATLVARCLAGEAAAWSALVQRYQRLVYTVAMRIGLDEHGAADVFQTVFSRLLEHLPRLQQPDRLQAWIVTTAKREALLQRRRDQRHFSISGDDDNGQPDWDMADDALLPEAALSELQQLNALNAALQHLDDRCGQLLKLLFQDDDQDGYTGIAATLQMPIGSIGPTRARCLDKLRRILQRQTGLG